MPVIHTKSTKRSGFTMIETLVAIVILVIAVLGPMSILTKAINDSNYAQDQIIAFYLAQEGLEMAINAHDNFRADAVLYPGNYDDDDWLSENPDIGVCLVGTGCYISNLANRSFSACPSGSGECGRMAFANDQYVPAGQSESATIFSRLIKIDEINISNRDGSFEPRRAKVFSIVSWEYGNRPMKIELTTYIYQ
jgi:prepilin-type N-terminal cleavage/methylation domain-containing protein